MFDTPAELLAKIRLGEDSLLELKAVRFSGKKVAGPSRSDLADELAAFGNFVSGVVVLGVDDKTREIEGIPLDRLDVVEDLLRELVNDAITPPLPVRIERLELPAADGELRALIKVDVPRSLFVHRSPGGYLHRIGSSKREMAPDLLARLFQQRSQARLIRFDEQAVPGTTPDALEERLWRRFVPADAEEPGLVLEKLRLVVEGDESHQLAASVAGVLLCSPTPRVWISSARIEAVHYRGTERDADYQRDARTFDGPLDVQITGAFRWVMDRMSVSAVKVPERIDIPQFASRAVFEALVNAVAHRDYAIYGSAIRLFLFDNRLEISSPGGLPNTMDVSSMPLRQFTRNELVASLLARAPVDGELGVRRGAFMEKRGEGVPLIVRETVELTGREPTYSVLDESEVLLTIPAAG